MMIWEKELFCQKEETQEIMPPLAGTPAVLEKYKKGKILVQPIIRRKNYLTNDWTHFNLARAERPISRLGMEMKETECFFCPGKEDKTPRAVKTGEDYLRKGQPWNLRIFPNLYPWLINHLNVVETAEHKVSLARTREEEEISALEELTSLTKELTAQGSYPVIFRNQGWGASLAHYHWQFGGLPSLPNRVNEEYRTSKSFFTRYKKDIFETILQQEKHKNHRWIGEMGGVAILAPFAPRTNFEVWLVSRNPTPSLVECSPTEIKNWGRSLNWVLERIYQQAKIDTLNIVIHQIPACPVYRLHLEILPFKHLAGAERGFEEYAVEITPEKVAEILKK